MKIKHLAVGLLTGFLLAAGMPFVSADSSVEAVSDTTFLYLDTQEVWLTEDAKAVDRKDGSLAIVDKKGKQKMAMRNIEAAEGGVGFYVRELRVPGEPKRFWEILATVGAHDQNCGYWLIAEENGKWSFELMVEDLIVVGYRPQEWHLLSSEIENGTYILRSAIEYMPDGAQYQYERKLLIDWQAELVWSEKTRSFLLRPLPLG